MFRRKEDGTEIDTNDDAPVSYTAASGSAASTSSATSTPSTPAAPSAPITPAIPVATAPAAQPAAPAFRPVAPAAAMAAANRATPAASPAPASAPAPLASAPAAAAPVERTAATPVARPASKRVLTVGPEIQMKGEVTSCDRVIIEGTVDATMRDVHTVELAESGSLKGTAEVEDAEISGAFEGDLVVRGRLTVYSSGRVRGNVTYGEIEIQRGGQISGNIRNVAEAKAGMPQPQPAKKAA